MEARSENPICYFPSGGTVPRPLFTKRQCGRTGPSCSFETRVNGQLMKKDNIKKTFLWEKQYGEGKYNKTPTCPVWHVIWRVM